MMAENFKVDKLGRSIVNIAEGIDHDDNQAAAAGSSVNRLRAAFHYTVGTICDEMVTCINDDRIAKSSTTNCEQVAFSKGVVAAIADTTFKMAQLCSADLIAFAKHANRTTVNKDDVKLLVRRNPQLLEHINKLSDKLAKERAPVSTDQSNASESGTSDDVIKPKKRTAFAKNNPRPSKSNPNFD